jgi:hypothetical protein
VPLAKRVLEPPLALECVDDARPGLLVGQPAVSELAQRRVEVREQVRDDRLHHHRAGVAGRDAQLEHVRLVRVGVEVIGRVGAARPKLVERQIEREAAQCGADLLERGAGQGRRVCTHSSSRSGPDWRSSTSTTGPRERPVSAARSIVVYRCPASRS